MRKLIATLLLCLTGVSMASVDRGDYPRGIRNNNPGNIIATSIPWQGKVQCEEESTFECFGTPYHGLRAMLKNIKTYIFKHNIFTFEEFFYRYSPPHENRTDALVKYFEARFVGHDMLSVDLLHFIEELIILENGVNPYARQYLGEVIEHVFPNSGGDDYGPRRSIRGWVIKNLGHETPVPNRTKPSYVQHESVAKAVSYRGSRVLEQILSVDKKGNRPDRSIFCHTTPETGSTIHRYYRDHRVDGVGEWFSFLYRWKRDTQMANCSRASHHPSRHSLPEPDRGNVFRWFSGGTQ